MKTVGIVTAWYPAGAGHVSKQYEAALARRHRVFIYARGVKDAKGDPDWDHSNVTWAPKHFEGTGVWRRHFQRWIKKNAINVVIFNEQRFWPAVGWAKEVGVVCGAYVDYYTQTTVPQFVAYDFLICNTLRHYSVFKWHPTCYYIPWGVMPELLMSHISNESRPITFLASAGWTTAWDSDRRGAQLALRAFCHVKGDCRFKIYSQRPFDKMTKEWQTVISGDSRIHLVVGTFSPFPYSDGDVYVYPSRLDGIGLTLPEAIGNGLPAITTDCAPMSEFVKDGVNGKLVCVDHFLGRADGYYWPESICDEFDLAKKMQFYVDGYENISEYKKLAKQYARENLDWMKNSQKLCDIIESVKQTCEMSCRTSEFFLLCRPVLSCMASFINKLTKYILYTVVK